MTRHTKRLMLAHANVWLNTSRMKHRKKRRKKFIMKVINVRQETHVAVFFAHWNVWMCVSEGFFFSFPFSFHFTLSIFQKKGTGIYLSILVRVVCTITLSLLFLTLSHVWWRVCVFGNSIGNNRFEQISTQLTSITL